MEPIEEQGVGILCRGVKILRSPPENTSFTLIVDNYDSYTYNLYQYIYSINGRAPVVVYNDAFDGCVQKMHAFYPSIDNIVISPGPGRPEVPQDFGLCATILKTASLPVLAVCLGHQGLAHVEGGSVEFAEEVMHGRLSNVVLDQNDELFRSLPPVVRVVRYHSLVVSPTNLPKSLRVTAYSLENDSDLVTPSEGGDFFKNSPEGSGVIMALSHKTRPIKSVQFHPESVATEFGYQMMLNFASFSSAYNSRYRVNQRECIHVAEMDTSDLQGRHDKGGGCWANGVRCDLGTRPLPLKTTENVETISNDRAKPNDSNTTPIKLNVLQIDLRKIGYYSKANRYDCSDDTTSDNGTSSIDENHGDDSNRNTQDNLIDWEHIFHILYGQSPTAVWLDSSSSNQITKRKLRPERGKEEGMMSRREQERQQIPKGKGEIGSGGPFRTREECLMNRYSSMADANGPLSEIIKYSVNTRCVVKQHKIRHDIAHDTMERTSEGNTACDPKYDSVHNGERGADLQKEEIISEGIFDFLKRRSADVLNAAGLDTNIGRGENTLPRILFHKLVTLRDNNSSDEQECFDVQPKEYRHLEEYENDLKKLPPFCCGYVGYFGYDLQTDTHPEWVKRSDYGRKLTTQLLNADSKHTQNIKDSLSAPPNSFWFLADRMLSIDHLTDVLTFCWLAPSSQEATFGEELPEDGVEEECSKGRVGKEVRESCKGGRRTNEAKPLVERWLSQNLSKPLVNTVYAEQLHWVQKTFKLILGSLSPHLEKVFTHIAPEGPVDPKIRRSEENSVGQLRGISSKLVANYNHKVADGGDEELSPSTAATDSPGNHTSPFLHPYESPKGDPTDGVLDSGSRFDSKNTEQSTNPQHIQNEGQTKPADPQCTQELKFEPNRKRQTYIENVKTAIEQIKEGETYEVCLTNQLIASTSSVDPWELYLILRRNNPAPYSCYLRHDPFKRIHRRLNAKTSQCSENQNGFDSFAICSCSPEKFLSISVEGCVESKPIKGTRKRALDDPVRDEELRADLEVCVKDRAENLMIVDLIRNDLGKVCDAGSIRVPVLMATETYASVHQLVSTVTGQVSKVSPVEVVRACFPGGSMTGAPKLRTMQIIDSLEEKVQRGIYSGAIGYFSLTGASTLSIVIRTAIVTPKQIRIGAGGAIIALSNPEDEYDEMLLKAELMMKCCARAHDEGLA